MSAEATSQAHPKHCQIFFFKAERELSGTELPGYSLSCLACPLSSCYVVHVLKCSLPFCFFAFQNEIIATTEVLEPRGFLYGYVVVHILTKHTNTNTST